MKTTFAAAALAALPLASATFDISMLSGMPGFAGLPQCATSCVMKTLTSTNCGVLDFKCICSSQGFLETALKCVDSTCSVDNTPVEKVNKFAEQAIDIARSLCSKIGIDLAMPDISGSLTVGGSVGGSGNANGNANANANGNANANAGGYGSYGAKGSSGSNNSGNSDANANASASASVNTAMASSATVAADSVASTVTADSSAASSVNLSQNGTDSSNTDAVTFVTSTAYVTSATAFGGTASTAASSAAASSVASSSTYASSSAASTDVSSVIAVAANSDVSYMTVVTSSCSMVPVTSLVPVSIAAVATPEPSAATSIAMVYNQTVPTMANPSIPAMFTGAASSNAVSGAGFAAMALGAVVAML